MLQAINTDFEMSLRTAPLSQSNVRKTPETEIQKKAQGSQNIRTDSVEISEQARAAMQRAGTVVSTGEKAAAGYDSKRRETQAASGRPEKLLEAQKKQRTEERSKSKHYADLSLYTESELKKLVSDGVITKFQQQEEVAKRAARKQEAEENEAKKLQKKSARQQAVYSYKAQKRREIPYAAIGKYLNRVA